MGTLRLDSISNRAGMCGNHGAAFAERDRPLAEIVRGQKWV